MAVLEELISHMRSKPETVFMGGEALVASLKKTQDLIRKVYVV
jgi:hypothetical protein